MVGKKRMRNSEDPSTSSKRRNVDSTEIQNTASSSNDSSSSFEVSSLRSGKVIKIQLKNFMCHSNLRVDFNNRINFLIGNNGSGKSAILIALVVGLGANARITNRGSNLKQLIKNGENSTTIEITIANNGSDSYENDIYGDKITVIRHITISGSSKFKIKNSHGKIVSTSRDDLHSILLYLNIQPENPVFVLNQDSARTFLKELEPEKCYSLFLKATQIETVLEKLMECEHMWNKFAYILDCRKKTSEFLRKNVSELKEKYHLLQSAEDIKLSIKKHQLELLWVDVSDQETLVAELQRDIEKISYECQSLREKLANEEGVKNELMKKISVLESELNEQSSSIEIENRALNELHSDYIRESEEFENEYRKFNKLKEKRKHLVAEIEMLDTNIKERSESSTSHINKLRQENEQNINNLLQHQSELQAMIESTKLDLGLLSNTKHHNEELHEDLKIKRSKVDIQNAVLKRELNLMKSSKEDNLSIYGEHMSNLLSCVQHSYKEGKFTELPRGPLGRYIEVPNKKWRGVVENLLSNLLHMFLVNSSKDREVLDDILKGFPGVRHSIITTKFQKKVYDVRNGMVISQGAGAHLFMKEIKCSDPVVMNCLIDRCAIETILFVEDQDLAVHLTSEEENVPLNLAKVILLNPFIEYHPAPLYRAYSLELRPPRYIQINTAEREKQILKEIAENSQQKLGFESQLRQLQEKIREIYQHINEKKNIREKHERTIVNVQQQLKELKNVEYPNENEVEILTLELNEFRQKLEIFKQQIEESEQKCNVYKQSVLEKNKSFRNQKAKIDNIEVALNQFRAECDKHKLELNSFKSDKRHLEIHLEKLQTDLEELKQKFTNEKENLQNYLNKVSNVGERVDCDCTKEELVKRIRGMEKKVQLISECDDKIENIQALLEDNQLKLSKNDCLVEGISETLELLYKARLQRFKMLSHLKEYMAIRVEITFDSILKVLAFDGSINIDHRNQKLSVSVTPRDSHIPNAVSNTKSLSGGERSYTTVAFLLSLWSCVDHPFYFLDEYDVFTDQVNREIMTELLLNEGKKKAERQYIYLTPQDMSFLEVSNLIKIHKLAEPKR